MRNQNDKIQAPADYLAQCLGAALRGADVQRIELEAFAVYPFIKTDLSFDNFLFDVKYHSAKEKKRRGEK